MVSAAAAKAAAAAGKVRQGPVLSMEPQQLSSSASPLSVDYLLILLTKMTLWKLLGRIVSPVWRLMSVYWYFGSITRRILLDARRLSVRLIGLLSAPCTGSVFRELSYQLWLIRRWHVLTAAIVGIGVIHKLIKQWIDSYSPTAKEKRRLAQIMATTSNHREWAEAASALDQLDIATMPRAKVEELKRHEQRLYDANLLDQHRSHLEAVRKAGDMQRMVFSLRGDLLRNLGNMTNTKLHEHRPVVPGPIRSYIDEVATCLRTITAYEGPDLSPEEKLSFLRETRHAFGRTALVLSGGGALGAFHLGMVKALLTNNLLPRVVAGSSVGSIISSLIATRSDEELKFLFENIDSLDLSFYNNNSPSQLFAHFLTKGSLQDVSVLQHRLKCLIGDCTFQEAYEKTGRILNVVVCAADTNEPPRLLNYLTAPQAIIWSAVAASSAFPLLFHPAEILARNSKGEIVQYIGDWGHIDDSDSDNPKRNSRRWFDGSLEQDLPMRGLSEMFNVNYFLVSQANPHVVPLLYLKSKVNGTIADVLESEWKHRCNQLQRLLPDWFPTKLLTLVSQTWEGDITVTLPYKYCQVGKAIINPTRESLYEAIMAGQRQTWAKLAAIQCNCSIEVTLDRSLNMVVAKERQRRRQQKAAEASVDLAVRSLNVAGAYIGKPPGRIPSWLMMSSLGGNLSNKMNDGSSENDGYQYSEDGDSAMEGHFQRVGSNGSLNGHHAEDIPRNASSDSINPALGLPCGGGVHGFEIGSPTPEPIPFGSYNSAREFWSRLLPVACASTMDDRDVEALDFIAP